MYTVHTVVPEIYECVEKKNHLKTMAHVPNSYGPVLQCKMCMSINKCTTNNKLSMS